jgi:CopG family transcriptional regulator, nickel-responsive regulator
MQRVTITIDDDLAAELDRFMSAHGYANRSEAIRDLARSGLQQSAHARSGTRPCVAALVYVYEHEKRELARRLTSDYHARHDLAQATLHVHLDEASCLEVTVLKGRGTDVQEFADHIIAERVTCSICRQTRRLRIPPALRMDTVMATATVAVTDAALEQTGLMLAVAPTLAHRESFAREQVFYGPFGSLRSPAIFAAACRAPVNLQRARAWPDRHRPEQNKWNGLTPARCGL